MSGYTRQSSADIVPTAIVKAAPLNTEFNKLRDAFDFDTTGATGHHHDGTADEGSYVPLIADIDGLNKFVIDTSNNRISAYVEVSSTAVEQIRIEDGVMYPVTTNDVDLGTSSLEFKDAFFSGDLVAASLASGANGYTVIADNTYTVSSGNLTFDVTGDVIFDADNADIFFKDAGTTFGVLSNNSGEMTLKSGTTAAINFTGANTDLLGTLDVTGAATLDSTVTVAGTATLSGAATVGTTLGVTGATTLSSTLGVTGATTLNDTLTVTGDTTVGGNLTVNGTLSTLNTTNTVVSDTLIELGNGVTGGPTNDSGIVIERGSSDNAFIGFDESVDKFIVGTGTFTGASTGNLTVTKGTLQANLDFDSLSDGTVSVTAILDEDDMASDSATSLATQQSIKKYVDDVAGSANNIVGLTASAAELNKLDASAASSASVTIVDADGFILIDDSATETKQALASDISTYVGSKDLANLANASTARTNLGVVIGTDVQAFDAQLADVAGLTPTATHAIVGDGTNFISTGSSTEGIQVPTGTTAQRPTPANGMFRYNSDDGIFEGYAAGAWGAIGGGLDTQTATTTSVAQTAVASYAVASYLGMELTVIATDTVATERTISKLIITHDGTTAVATEYGTVDTATAMATYDVDISSGNIRLLATAASTNNTNYITQAVLFEA
jgi:hypothetical protein